MASVLLWILLLYFVHKLEYNSARASDETFFWWTTNSLTKVHLYDSPPPNYTQRVTLRAQAGEIESFQVHIKFSQFATLVNAPHLTNPSLSFIHMSWRKVVHIFCNKSTIYPSGSRSGYQPDALVEASYFYNSTLNKTIIPLEESVVHSFWLRFRIERNAVAGEYNNMALALQTSTSGVIYVNISLTIWPIQLPTISHSFGTIFSFPYKQDSDGATNIAKYYNSVNISKDIKKKYFDMLCELRIPADNPYLVAPREIEDYIMLSACGSPKFNLLNVESVAGSFVNSTMVYTHEQVEAVIGILTAIVSALDTRGLLDRAYVYGFDERPRSYAAAIKQLFGEVKKAFPQLRTVATLRWQPEFDMNIDVWVNLYSLWNASAARAFRASKSGREAWAYHCISPRPSGNPPNGPVRFLNTFLEYPPMDPRLLSWWAGTYNADGWLYYLVDGWEDLDHHEPLRLLPGTSTRTNFSAIRFNGAAIPGQPNAFSNGDGILIYPGLSGPLASTRVERYRDGLEDLELLRSALRHSPTTAKHATEIIRTVIKSFVPETSMLAGVNATDDPDVLENARIGIAKLLIEELLDIQKSEVDII